MQVPCAGAWRHLTRERRKSRKIILRAVRGLEPPDVLSRDPALVHSRCLEYRTSVLVTTHFYFEIRGREPLLFFYTESRVLCKEKQLRGPLPTFVRCRVRPPDPI